MYVCVNVHVIYICLVMSINQSVNSCWVLLYCCWVLRLRTFHDLRELDKSGQSSAGSIASSGWERKGMSLIEATSFDVADSSCPFVASVFLRCTDCVDRSKSIISSSSAARAIWITLKPCSFWTAWSTPCFSISICSAVTWLYSIA